MAWSALDLLARCPGYALVALDLSELPRLGSARFPPAFGLRLQRAVEGSETILVLRTPHRLAGSAAALVISLRRVHSRWMGSPSPTRFAGLVSEARILRSRLRSSAIREEGEGSRWLIDWAL
jgi:hypothetical protein